MKRSSLLFGLLFLMGCQLERLAPQSVGEGVSRLAILGAAAVTKQVSGNSACGFASEQVLRSAELEGEIGRRGTVTLRVIECTIDNGPTAEVSKDCQGRSILMGGKITVNATRTIKGLLTGNPLSPVIPETPDAVATDLEVAFDGYEVRKPAQGVGLLQRSGGVSFHVDSHLALSNSKGLCTVGTAENTFRDIRYSNAKLRVESKGNQFEVDVPSSNLSAQMGKWGERENDLSGRIEVWDAEVQVLGQAGGKLDPAYTPEEFAATYLTCERDLVQPVNYTCPTVTQRAADGVARLTVSTFGTLASLIDKNTECGFSSKAVLAAAELAGKTGERGGTATWRLAKTCSIELPEPVAVSTNCGGVSKLVRGTIHATGIKTIRGILTGDVAAPVIPTTAEAADIRLVIDLQNVTLSDSVGGPTLALRNGRLSGVLGPRLALDTKSGACSVSTPAARFSELVLEGAVVQLSTEGNTLALEVDRANLEAQNGRSGDTENYLVGTVTTGGQTLTVPSGAPVLDPSYSAQAFEQSWLCMPDVQPVVSNDECSFDQTLAVNAARLLVQNVAAVAKRVNADGHCGFETLLVKLRPSASEGRSGEQGSLSWTIDGCEIGQEEPARFDTDCHGNERWQVGTAEIAATRTVTGIREQKFLLIKSIVPNSRESVTLQLTNVGLTNWTAFSLAPNTVEPVGSLTIHSGALSAKVVPVLGESADEPGVFDVPTPVSKLSAIVLRNATATLRSGKKSFALKLPEVVIDAVNGTWGGVSNRVIGSVRLDNRLVRVDAPLDPSFSQSRFDESYACTDGLRDIIR